MKPKNAYLTALIIGLALMALFSPPVLSAESHGPDALSKVIPRDSVAYGRTYAEWSAAWQQWSLSTPVSTHPLFDNGDCSVGQSGPVWFLGGKYCVYPPVEGHECPAGFASRTCTVPAGKALFFPVLNVPDTLLEEQAGYGPGAFTINEMRAFIAELIDGTADLKIKVDGIPIPDLKKSFRVQSTVFSFTLPDDNLLNAIGEGPFAAGAYSPAVDDGVYVMLKPLSPGQHTISIKGSFPLFDFHIDVLYQITVEP